MKLLVVSSWLPYPLDNGSRVRAYRLLEHLSRRHDLTVLCFGTRRPGDELGPLPSLCRRLEIVAPARDRDRRLGPRGLLSAVPRHFVQADSPRMRRLVAAAVVGQDAAIGLQVDAARYLAEWRNLPRVFEEAEVTVYRERYLRAPSLWRRGRDGLTWWKFRRFARDLVGRFERTTVVSEKERENLAACGCDPARVSVIPNGVDAPAAPIVPPGSRRRCLVYPGAVTYSANLDAVAFFVRDVLPLIRRAQPGLEFLVTGSTEGVDVRGLAAAEGVRFTGRLPEVDSLVAQSAACVVPLRTGGGTRVKVLQAMTLGTPVISTSKGVEGLDVEADRHVLVADDPGTFARRVTNVLADPSLAARLGAAARGRVRERYAWGGILDGLERVLHEAVESRGPGERPGTA